MHRAGRHLGDSWVHPRECQIRGHVGCRDSSENRHATKHLHATSHPSIQEFEPGEDWLWCYVDDVMKEPARQAGPSSDSDAAR